jgi:RNA recognition motif-containing protein
VFFEESTKFYGEKQRSKEIGMQGSKLYVGNLSYSVVNDDLKELFSNYGIVEEVKVIEGKGFGFVEMSTQAEAEKAKEALSGFDLKGRTLRVDEARPRRNRQRRGYRRY